MTPDEYCQDKAAQSGSSFYYSFMFLPPQRRRAITALYAFCREVDDIVDECADSALAQTKLAWWQQELARLYAGSPQHPVTRALEPAIEPFGIKHEYLTEIIAGMQMDLSQNRYLDFPALEQYCHRVAGVVGLLAASIFGYQDERTLAYAHTLGLAFQLTNIIRDVGEDSRKGRIYLPMNELRQFNVSPADILHARQTENFARLMTFQIERAERYYGAALEQLPQVDRKAQRPGLIMAAIYRTLLREIANDGCKVLNQRTALPPLRKLWIACRTWFTA
ncbi:MAG TPA: presqualene diphosphate synthase HpnD [Burkholderiales bacterium]|nr:presqualene diphosphate synthase HpnD [Burkholderiales bacterium]